MFYQLALYDINKSFKCRRGVEDDEKFIASARRFLRSLMSILY